MPPLRRAVFMSFSAVEPLVRPVYQRELSVVSVPASEKAKPDAGVGGVEDVDLAGRSASR